MNFKLLFYFTYLTKLLIIMSSDRKKCNFPFWYSNSTLENIYHLKYSNKNKTDTLWGQKHLYSLVYDIYV
jgi:hypothetical protein